ncbi:probable G-protein coupled receptor Mth-like 3, partial [Aricia agestis]|uniref:probable G-protein coupled receptor Mth-like 3 n=1 Tax=Aricia agestis TaxID=91739 RepID=UPI001C20A403
NKQCIPRRSTLATCCSRNSLSRSPGARPNIKMWKPILDGLIFFSTLAFASEVSYTNSSVFNKCCSEDRSLIRVTDDVNSSVRYECVDRKNLTEAYGITEDPVHVGAGVEIYEGMPVECEEPKTTALNKADDALFAGDELCYDTLVAEIFNGSMKQNIPKFVALSCSDTAATNKTYPEPALRLHRVRKCCPRGERYDRTYHQCRESHREVPLDWGFKLSNDSLYEVQYGLDCKNGEYAVELHDSLYTLDIDGSNLVAVKKESDRKSIALPGEWCIDRDYNSNGLVARVCTNDCEKFGAYCVAKCCPPGHHFRVSNCNAFISRCVPNEEDSGVFYNLSKYLDPLKLTTDRKDFLDVMGLRFGVKCPAGRYALNESIYQDLHSLTHDAYLEHWGSVTKTYCLEMFDRRHCPSNDIIVTALLCFLPGILTKDFRISFYIITVSSVCLALTLVVYCALPELRNLHGRNLICHVATMLLACACLARVQYRPVQDNTVCTALGYGIYFGFVAAFAWLNVMCFDIWWTFGSVRTVQPLRKSSSERKRFLWYSLYAWGVTVLLTTTMYLLDRYPVSYVLDANIGHGACWFGTLQNTDTDWPHYIFFVVPLGLVTCTNFVLWLLTARHCAQVKSEVHRLQAGSVGDRAKRRFRIDRAKYILTGKLWVVMGAGWVSELLSTIVVQPQWLWLVVDLFNEMQGVFIFMILVFKPKVYYLIKKRLGLSRTPIDPRLEKPDARKTATSSGRTSSTFLSRTISSDERTTLRTSLPNSVKNS